MHDFDEPETIDEQMENKHYHDVVKPEKKSHKHLIGLLINGPILISLSVVLSVVAIPAFLMIAGLAGCAAVGMAFVGNCMSIKDEINDNKLIDKSNNSPKGPIVVEKFESTEKENKIVENTTKLEEKISKQTKINSNDMDLTF